MWILLNIIIIGIEFFALLKIADTILDRLPISKTRDVFITLLFLLGTILFSCFFNLGTTAIKLLVASAWCFIMLMFRYRGKIFRKIFVIVIYNLFTYSIDIGVLIFLMYFTKKTVLELTTSTYGALSGIAISRSILIIFAFLFNRYYINHKTKEKMSALKWCQLLIVPVCLLLNLAVVLFQVIDETGTNFMVLADVIFLLLATFSYLYLEEQVEYEQRKKNEYQILQDEMRRRMEQAEIYQENFENQRAMIHDFNHHLCTIEELLRKENHVQAMNYMNQVLDNELTISEVITTENSILDALLNYKYSVAKKHLIAMQFDITSFHELPCEESEMVILIGNLLDNAIEACQKIKGRKIICFKWIDDSEMILCSVRNTVEHDVEIQDGELETTKKEKQLHGYGLKNVRHIVNKSGGISELACKDGWFQYTIIWNRRPLGTI